MTAPNYKTGIIIFSLETCLLHGIDLYRTSSHINRLVSKGHPYKNCSSKSVFPYEFVLGHVYSAFVVVKVLLARTTNAGNI